MRYVVIGSNSFTGSWMADTLLENPENYVFGISRSPEKKDLYLRYKRNHLPAGRYSFLRLDIVKDFNTLVEFLDYYKPEIVINYAAQTEVFQSHLTPASYFETNTLAVVRLCHELSKKEYLKRYVHISSAEVYGPCTFPVREATPPRPTTPYAVSKLAADYYLMTLNRYNRFPVTIIRSTNVYGKHQQLYKIIPRVVIRLWLGQKIELHERGTFIRPFIHVKDACSGVLAAIEKGETGEIYNFSTQNTLSIGEVVRLICSRMGYNFDENVVFSDERTGHDICYKLDYSKAAATLKWKDDVPFEDGVGEVIDWIKENWEEIKREPLAYIHRE